MANHYALGINISFGTENHYVHHLIWCVVLCVNIVKIQEVCTRNEHEMMFSLL